MNILEIGLAAVALIVIVGGPIWFAVKARPIGSLPYRWGTYVGIWGVLLSIVLLGASIKATEGHGSPGVGLLITAAEFAGAVGVLRRKRWGVVLLLTNQTAIILISASVNDLDVRPSFSRSVASLVGIALNIWYFGRRWTLLSQPWSSSDSGEDTAPDQVAGQADSPGAAGSSSETAEPDGPHAQI